MRLDHHPVLWAALALLLLAMDLLSGPHIQFPIAYVVPVMLAAWNGTLPWALGLAAFLSTARLANHLIWGLNGTVLIAAINTIIRVILLSIIALLTYRYGEKRRQVKLLEGLLPICMHCKRIKDETDNWQKLEKFIMDRSKAQFTHSLCSDCFNKYYPEFIRPPFDQNGS